MLRSQTVKKIYRFHVINGEEFAVQVEGEVVGCHAATL
jgi:sulfur carrier protein ThiS